MKAKVMICLILLALALAACAGAGVGPTEQEQTSLAAEPGGQSGEAAPEKEAEQPQEPPAEPQRPSEPDILEQARAYIEQRLSAEVTPQGLLLNIDDVPYLLALPAQEEGEFAGLTLGELSFAETYEKESWLTAELMGRFDAAEIQLCSLRFFVNDWPYGVICDLHALYLPDLPYPVVPGAEIAAEAGLPDITETSKQFGISIRLPGLWQGQYIFQPREEMSPDKFGLEADESEDEGTVFMLYDALAYEYNRQYQLENYGKIEWEGGCVFMVSAYPLADFRERFAYYFEHGFPGRSSFIGHDGDMGYILTQASDVQYENSRLGSAHYWAMEDAVPEIIAGFMADNNIEPFAAALFGPPGE